MKFWFTYLVLLTLPLFVNAQSDSLVITYYEEDTTRIKATRLSINSTKSDFSPVILGDNLLFASAREKTTGIKYSGYEDNSEITDLYISSKKDSVSFKNVHSLPGKINSKYSEGPFTISKDGNTIYYTGNTEIKGRKKNKTQGLLKIYCSQKVNGAWGEPVLVSFCVGDFSYCHPCLCPNGKDMIFCSNMSGGFGGMDIYMTRLENGIWAKPFNLGAKVNTSSNEIFPFISQSNTLYFSSERTDGIGGLDIFSFDLNDLFESEAILLEYPVNSSHDDFGIWTDSLGTTGYFSTNRISKYSDDIYYFATRIPDFNDAAVPVFKTKFCYTFFEETAVETNDSTGFSYEWDFNDGHKSKQLKVRHCFEKPGKYNIQLNAIDKSTGDIFSNELNYVLVIDEPPKLHLNCPDTVALGNEIIINSEKSSITGYELNKTYWQFGDGKYNSGKYVKHVYNKPGKYIIQLGVSAKNSKTNKVEKFRMNKEVYVREKF